MCTKAKVFIDFHGNVMAEHVLDRNFDLNSVRLQIQTVEGAIAVCTEDERLIDALAYE